MKKFAIVSLAAILASGCAYKPKEMTTDELCEAMGHSQAAGYSDQIDLYEELKTRRVDIGRCKMYQSMGARHYYDSVKLMNDGLQMMSGG